MIWTALVPFKPPGARKQRLAAHLSGDRRDRIAERMFDHVVAVLRASPLIADVTLLADACPAGWTGAWLADRGGGLNAELTAARAVLGPVPLLVIHGDLPLLAAADIAAILSAAETSGLAVAGDRFGTGTNAIAIADGRSFAFAFGADSLRRHRAAAGDAMQLVTSPGLAHDIDTAEDLNSAISAGFDPGW